MSSKLKIITDIDCQIYCDYEYVGGAISGHIFHLNLRKGIYLLEFKKDTVVLATQRYKMESNDEEDLLELSLLDAYNGLKRDERREKVRNLSVIWYYTGSNWRIESTKEEVLNPETNETWIDLPINYVLLPMGKHRDPDIDCCGYIPFNIGGIIHSDDLVGHFIEGGMWGCLNKIGEVIIPTIYRSKVFFWNDQVTTIKEFNILKGLINYNGELVFKEFDRLRPLNESRGLYIAIKDNKFGVIDKYGKCLINPQYSDYMYTGKDSIWTKDIHTNCWGLLDFNSKILTSFIYHKINLVKEYCFVCKDEMWGIINHSGNYIIQPNYKIISICRSTKTVESDEWGYDFVDCVLSIVKNEYNKYGIVNTDFHDPFLEDEFREIIPCKYDAIYSLNGEPYSEEEIKSFKYHNLESCYFVFKNNGLLHCDRYIRNASVRLLSFDCEYFNEIFAVKSNRYYFLDDFNTSFDLISSIEFYDGTYFYQSVYAKDSDFGEQPIKQVKEKNKTTFWCGKLGDKLIVFYGNSTKSLVPFGRKRLFDCICDSIIEFGTLVSEYYFAIVEINNSRYLYVIDNSEIVHFKSEAFKEVYSTYHILGQSSKYYIDNLSNEYFVARLYDDKWVALNWFCFPDEWREDYEREMLISRKYDFIKIIDEFHAEVHLYENNRTLYNILLQAFNERGSLIYRNWMVSPYNERNSNYVAAYDFAEQKEGIILNPMTHNNQAILIPYKYDYARIFGGKKSIIICLGNGQPEQIKCAVLDAKQRYLTTEIFDPISVGWSVKDLGFHIDNQFSADVNLDNDDLAYSLPFLDFITYSESGERKRTSPFSNVRLYIDIETTGLPIDYKESYAKSDNWPYIVQVAMIIEDDNHGILAKRDIIVKPDNYIIPGSAYIIHGITNEKALERGDDRERVFNFLDLVLSNSETIIGHNVSFDLNIIKAEIVRIKGIESVLFEKKKHTLIDTMRLGKDICKIPENFMYGDYKYPKLDELYYKLFNKHFDNQHNAMADIEATYECYKEIIKRRNED